MKELEVKNLFFAYSDDEIVVKDVSFEIEKGTYTTIIGHNGSGKSTIAKLLIGLIEAKSGEIYIEDELLSASNINKIREKIAIVFQNPDNQFIGATVRDDIAFGLENRRVDQKDMDPIIDEFSKKVWMKEFLDKEPTKLSGGQKQRVAIAGVLAMNPEIIIFDESTSMLDPSGKKEIKDMIMNLHNDSRLTIISITHDIDEVVNSDHVIVLNRGEKILDGDPKDIMVKEDILSKIGLDIPFSLKLVNKLKDLGIDIDSEIKMEGLVNKLVNRI